MRGCRRLAPSNSRLPLSHRGYMIGGHMLVPVAFYHTPGKRFRILGSPPPLASTGRRSRSWASSFSAIWSSSRRRDAARLSAVPYFRVVFARPLPPQSRVRARLGLPADSGQVAARGRTTCRARRPVCEVRKREPFGQHMRRPGDAPAGQSPCALRGVAELLRDVCVADQQCCPTRSSGRA